jgi:hypothetical protein
MWFRMVEPVEVEVLTKEEAEEVVRDSKGKFVKGHKCLPNKDGKMGRLAIVEETKESLAAMCPKAIERLWGLLNKNTIRDKDLIEVIKIIIERNLGKINSNIDVELQSRDNGEFQVQIKVID